MRIFLPFLFFAFQAIAGLAQPVRAYFLGHSLVNFDIPNMTQKLSDAARRPFGYRAQIGIGANLQWQWQKPYSAQGDIWDTTLQRQRFQHFILTEAVPLQGQLIYSNTSAMVDSFYRYAARYNPDIRLYVYETWHCTNTGTPTGCMWDPDNSTLWRPRLTRDLPKWEGILTPLRNRYPDRTFYLVPGGQALAMLSDSIDAGKLSGLTNIRNLFSDDIHLDARGNYFIACVMYAIIHQRSPEGLPFELTNPWGGPYKEYPTRQQALAMQRIAWRTVCGYAQSGVKCSGTIPAHTIAEPQQVKVLNNPVQHSLQLQCDEPVGTWQVALYNAAGQCILQQTVTAAPIVELPITGQAGFYWLRIYQVGKGWQQYKIVKLGQ